MQIMRVLQFMICFVLTSSLGAQNTPVAYFDFDDCSATDLIGNYNPGAVDSGLDCDCGVGENSSALYFNGTADSLELDGSLKDLFLGDFTLSFYLWMDNVSNVTSIMSVQGDCNTARDSALYIRYLPSSNEIVVELSKNFGEIITLRSELPESFCWNHVMLTRQDRTYSLYMNGQFVDQFIFFDQVVFGQDFPFLVGVTACSGSNEAYLRGRIDELRFFDYALQSETELMEEQLFPDQILTQDTTIFEGSTIQLKTAASCAPSVSWTPASFLDDTQDPNPMANPDETTDYTVSFDHGSCISTDNVRVSVLSEEEIQCGNILLPRAFTPNNDGINESYGISNNFIIDQLDRFEIYDRWGLKLYEGFDKSQGWDGSYNGEPMPPGTYVYKIEYTCRGERYKRTSSFNILK